MFCYNQRRIGFVAASMTRCLADRSRHLVRSICTLRRMSSSKSASSSGADIVVEGDEQDFLVVVE